MTPPLVVRRRNGWWYRHCRPCARTEPEQVLTQILAVETALTHLTRRHGHRVGFGVAA